MSQDTIKKAERILEEYFIGNITPELEGEIQAWLADGQNQEEKCKALKSVWEKRVKFDPEPGKFAVKSWNRACMQLGFFNCRMRRRLIPLKTFYRIAAIIVLSLTVGITVLVKTADKRTEPTYAQTTVSVPDEEYKHMVLPDQSEVVLYRGGEITFPEDFEANRTVTLNGEAFFRVVPLDGKTFEVKSRNLSVEVLGTEFNVKSYESEPTTTVTLATGTVSVKAGTGEHQLAPLEQLVLDDRTQQVSIREITEREVLEMRIDRLRFDNTPLREIFQRIGQYYEVTFVFDDRVSLENQIRAPFGKDESLEDMLYMLQQASGHFNYSIQGDSVLITRR